MGMKYHNCTRAAKVEREGLPYCGIHDPAAAQARADKREAKWAAKRKADEARWFAASTARARAELCVAACAGLSDAAVVKLAKSNRGELLDFITTPTPEYKFYFTGQGIPKI